MNKKMVMAVLLCVMAAAAGFAENLNFEGWTAWGGLQAAVRGNSVTLNGRVSTAGYVNEWRNAGVLKGKTVTLEIRNAGNSTFSEGRLIKITVNKNDNLVKPLNVTTLVHGEYTPASAAQVEFTLPPDFDGKLGFVFYQAELKDLVITATYR
jgi:hypothetical protein